MRKVILMLLTFASSGAMARTKVVSITHYPKVAAK